MVRKLGCPPSSSKPGKYQRSPSSSWLWPSCRPKNPLLPPPRRRRLQDGELHLLRHDGSCFTDARRRASPRRRLPTRRRSSGPPSDRLFFEPGDAASSSIMGGEALLWVPVQGASRWRWSRRTRLRFQSFHGGNGGGTWDHGLARPQELVWYLRANGKKTHGFIFGAFVDLLVDLSSSSPFSSSSLQ
ncbi:hypothetical protein HPP92_009559 [Vanilla planifolia]|uniref:OVATE domain-containing protein n=1 Tax=Vanilla planifolia TaxID=51239 RepID=A0A835V4T9_VANPL|nr:hypothetical protein HPP92_009559 [Vanilla planifolia]